MQSAAAAGLGNKESHADWLDFLRGMVARGLKPALTMTSDGAPGLLRALEKVFLGSLRLRCWVHRMRNVLDKLPNSARPEVKAWLHSVRDAPTPEAGREAAAETIARFEGPYPAAMKSFADDLEASLAQLRLPVAHREVGAGHEPDRAQLRGGAATHEGDPPLLHRAHLPEADLRGPGAGLTALAAGDHH